MNLRPFKCPACGRSFSNQGAIGQHQRDTGHQGEAVVTAAPALRKPPVEDDDDMGALYRGLREERQEKRAANTVNSTQLLIDAGIPFVSKNYGVHLIVAGTWDFWPSTGLWIDRRPPMPGHRKREHRGVQHLINRVKTDMEKAIEASVRAA